jgi:hypothetical protein
MNITELIRGSTKLKHFHSIFLHPQILSSILTELLSLKELSLWFDRGISRLGLDDSVDALVTAIARGDLVPNIQAFDLRWYNVLMLGRIIHSRITLRCRPEEVRPGFRDILITLSKQGSIDVFYEADGVVLGDDGTIKK